MGAAYGRPFRSTEEFKVEPAQAVASEMAQIDLKAIFRVLWRQRWVIVATIFIVIAVALLITSQLRPQYTATALVVVDSRDSQILGFQSGVAEAIGASASVDTEVEIARSATVLESMATKLDIAHSPDFAKKRSAIDILKSFVGMSDPVVPVAAGTRFADLPDDEQARLLELLADRVSVSRIGLTSVISMSATAPYPVEAAKMANVLADSYLTAQIAAKVDPMNGLRSSFARASTVWQKTSARSRPSSMTLSRASWMSLALPGERVAGPA